MTRITVAKTTACLATVGTALALLVAGPATAAAVEDESLMKCVPDEEYFFHADGTDDATFNHDQPTGTEAPGVQTTIGLASVDASWSGAFTGQTCGTAQVRLYVSWVTGADRIHVDLIADDGDVLGTTRADVPGTAITPTPMTVNVPVEGTVSSNLTVAIRPDLPAVPTLLYYGHETVPAGFTISTMVPCEVNDPHPDC